MASTPATSFCSEASDNSPHPAAVNDRDNRPTASLSRSLPSPSHTADSHASDTGAQKRAPAAHRDCANNPAPEPPAGERASETNNHDEFETDTDSSDDDFSECEIEFQDVQADEALCAARDIVWKHFCGLPTPSYPSFHFLGGQRAYKRFWRRLGDKHEQLPEHFEDNIRRDWNADTGDLTLRLMPTFAHDFVEDGVKLEVADEFKRMAQAYPALKPFCDNIRQCGHAEVKSYSAHTGRRTPHWEKSPDGQWHYNVRALDNSDAQQLELESAPVIFEVAFSESEKHVLQKALEYLTEHPGSTVLAFEIDYATPTERAQVQHARKARVTVWTSREEAGRTFVHGVMDRTVYRAGLEAPEGELSFPFRLFCPPTARGRLPAELQDVKFRISFERLAQIVTDAEDMERKVMAQRDAKPRKRKPNPVTFISSAGAEVADLQSTTKRRRTSSPGNDSRVPVRRRRSLRLGSDGA